MEEAPIPTDTPKEKTFELNSNKNNKFIITFRNIESSSLLISAVFDDQILKIFYETEFTLEKIKENKAFISYDKIEEILSELFILIDEGKIHLMEEKNNICIKFDLPFQKYKKIVFVIEEKKKTNEEKINELYNIIIKQNKEITFLKTNLNLMKSKLENIEINNKDLNKIMIKLENENKQILNNNNFEEKIITNLKSKIIDSFDKIDFIINRLQDSPKLKNKKISFNLLFKATTDGQLASDFHKKCDGKVQQLIFIKTTEGETFGGYTKVGFRNRGNAFKDNNAFVFSCYNKKIYNIKKEQNAIMDFQSNGPCFYSNGDYIIYIPNKMFDDLSYTCSISSSYYEGMTMDYEINNGDKYFNIQEIEVYQILYN